MYEMRALIGGPIVTLMRVGDDLVVDDASGNWRQAGGNIGSGSTDVSGTQTSVGIEALYKF